MKKKEVSNPTFTVRFTATDWSRIRRIMELDPKSENPSKAIYYAFQNAALNEIEFNQAAKYKSNTDNIGYDPSEYSSAKSFTVDVQDWTTVVGKFKNSFNLEKVRISYLTRLVLASYLMKLNNDTISEKVKPTTIDALELLLKVNNKAAELIKTGQLNKIFEFLDTEPN